MPEVFLSHSSKDNEFTRKLNNSLQYGSGVDIWVDFEHMRGGQNWPDTVDQALNDCRCMILVVSPNSMLSKNVKDEWQFFHGEGKLIIPVIIEPVPKLHFQLQNLHQVDFHKQNYDVALDQLKKALYREGIRLNEISIPEEIAINKNKTGNLFWLCHDLNELFYWLLGNVDKQWLDIGLRQSRHYMIQLGLHKSVINQTNQLISTTENLRSDDWTPEKRQRVALEVKGIFNTVAQIAQKADPNFDSGPG